MRHRVPDPSAAHVQAFCERLLPGVEPCWVDCRPMPGEPLRECFSIVPKQVAAEGGAQLVGWALWEWPHVLIEAEFHAVWQRPGGEAGGLLCVTPNALFAPRVLFLPDTGKEYTGRRIDNVRQALTKDWDITRFIFLHGELTEALDQGGLANQYGRVALRGKAARRVDALEKDVRQLQARLARRYPAEAD